MKVFYSRQNKHLISIFQLQLLLGLFFLCFFAKSVYATPSYNRLAGLTRYDTAVAIAKDGWQQSDYAVLAFGENYPDALASAPLAKKYDAPILLTDSASLTSSTKQALLDLRVKHVFIVGGTSVVSKMVEQEIGAMGIDVTRLAGNDRYDTGVRIAQQLGQVSSIIVSTGEDYADALSVGSIAGKLGMPIILVPKNTLTDSIKAYLASQNITSSYVIGNIDLISDSVLNQLPNAERIIGADKYERNIAILKRFDANYAADSICLATGLSFADALTGTAYASKKSLPILLLPRLNNQTIQNYINSKTGTLNKVIIFGGEAVVSSSLVDDYIQGKATSENQVEKFNKAIESDPIYSNPTANEDSIILVLSALSQSWKNNTLSDELYTKLKEKDLLGALGNLLDYKATTNQLHPIINKTINTMLDLSSDEYSLIKKFISAKVILIKDNNQYTISLP